MNAPDFPAVEVTEEPNPYARKLRPRMRGYVVEEGVLARMLCVGSLCGSSDPRIEVITGGPPRDAAYHGCRIGDYGKIILYFEHSSFDEVPLGSLVPEFNAEVRTFRSD